MTYPLSPRLIRILYVTSVRVVCYCSVPPNLPNKHAYPSLLQPAVFRAHTYSQFHKGRVFVDLFNSAWVVSSKARAQLMPYQLLISRLKDAGAKPAKFAFGWMSDTVAMLGKNADILTVRWLTNRGSFANRPSCMGSLRPPLDNSQDIFVEHFLRPVWNGVEAYLSQLDDDGVRSIQSKESIDALVLGARRLLRRVFPSAPVAAVKADQIMLDIALRCCKSSQLMKRRDGLRVLADAVQLAVNRDRYPYGFYAYTSPSTGGGAPVTTYQRMAVAVAMRTGVIAQMVTGHELLCDIFVSRHHRELIKMAGDLLRVISIHAEHFGAKQVSACANCITYVHRIDSIWRFSFDARLPGSLMRYGTATLTTSTQPSAS